MERTSCIKISASVTAALIFLCTDTAYCAAVNPKMFMMKRGQMAQSAPGAPQGQQSQVTKGAASPPYAADPGTNDSPAGTMTPAPGVHSNAITSPAPGPDRAYKKPEPPAEIPDESAITGTERDFTKIINDLKTSSVKWKEIAGRRLREMVVYFFISEYRERGIVIGKKPADYVALIDQMSAQSPDLLSAPFDQVLQVVAIIEYDFNNGQDKDAMAKRILGEESFLRNKERLGLQ